jgi:hypothetical protein
LVTLIYHVELPVDLRERPHIQVEELPVGENRKGKSAVMYLNPQTEEVWFEYTDRKLTLEEENQDLKEKQALMQQALDELILGGML